MNTIGARITFLVNTFANGKKSEFAKKVGTSEANVRNYLSGTQPKYDVLASIILTFVQVSPDWLMNGKGKVYRAQNPDKSVHLFEEYYKTKSSENVVENNDHKNDHIFAHKPKVPKNEAIETSKTPDIANQDDKKNELLKAFSLLTDKNIEHQIVPLYNIEATAGLVPIFSDTKNQIPIDYLQIPNLPPCDGAVHVTGDSMYPILKSGDIVLYKQIDDITNNIFWGEMYLISVAADDDEFITLKYIQKSDKGEKYVKLVRQNGHHQPRDISINRIRALAFVKASVCMNSMG